MMRSQARRFASALYRRAAYAYRREPGFTFELHPELALLTPSQWMGKPDGDEREELFFGYYDKTPWSADMSRMLLHRPSEDDTVAILLHDRDSGRRFAIGRSSAWNWQQGSMTRWLGDGSRGEVIFNDYAEGRLVSRIASISDGAARIVPWPIQVVHPDGGEALTLNYRRLDMLRPDYGYGLDATNFHADLPLADDGIWRIDLESGEAELGLSLARLAATEPRDSMRRARHKVNHFCYAPDGEHVVFLHRWVGRRGELSRLYAASRDLSRLRLLLDDDMVSHYSWRDDRRILAWARTVEHGDRYYLIDVLTGARDVVGQSVLDVHGDGHPSFSPDGRWILTDTYPDRARQQRLLLFHVDRGNLVELGRFLAPWGYEGVRRCDLHPRWSPDGKYVSIDSAHSGTRRSYIVDLRAFLETALQST